MATATNEIQEIQKILREFFGTRKSREIAVELYDIMHGEKQYFYNEKAFFVHKTARRLVLTMESSIKIHVQEILRFYHLGEDELQECLELVMLEHWKEKIAEYETIAIPASNSTIYTELMMHKARNDKEETFMNNLEEAIASSTGEFNVFVNDPSINSDGELQFVPGFRPASGYSYDEWKEIAKRYEIRLGTKNEYILFLGWLINSMMKEEGWSEEEAWNAVCSDSKEIGNCLDKYAPIEYSMSRKMLMKKRIELTGSRKVAGKCDLGNMLKILSGGAEDSADTFWLGGSTCISELSPIANIERFRLSEITSQFDYNFKMIAVGWFVK